MCEELKDYRIKINEIDEQILQLFEKRMKVIEQVHNYKKQHNLVAYDPKREQEMKQKYALKLSNVNLKPYYLQLLDEFLKISKQYQNDLN